MKYKFSAEVWLYNGPGAWHFITLPQDIADEIRDIFGTNRRGWGSIRVLVTIGKSSWNTSIFPDKKSNSYLLPIKAQIRQENSLTDGDKIKLKLEMNLQDQN